MGGREFDEYIITTEGVGAYGETPEEYLCRMETLHELMEVLNTCTEAQRRRFLLYALDGLSLAEIGVLCGCFCGIAFALYVHIYINPSAQETAVEISKGLGLNLNSFIYAKESDSDEYKLYETIKGKENREWVDSDKIPDTLKNAVVAIEDERFYKHHGVDWVRTIGAVKG